jgi:hypothetical protein
MLYLCSIVCTGWVQNQLNIWIRLLGVFVHCTVEEGKSIMDRILSVTPLKDQQFKAPLISENEPIITYPKTLDISALPPREELLQLTAPGIGSENEIEDTTPFPLSIVEDCFDDDIGNCNIPYFKNPS